MASIQRRDDPEPSRFDHGGFCARLFERRGIGCDSFFGDIGLVVIDDSKDQCDLGLFGKQIRTQSS